MIKLKKKCQVFDTQQIVLVNMGRGKCLSGYLS